MSSKFKIFLRSSLFLIIFAGLLVITSFIIKPKDVTKSGTSLHDLRNGVIIEDRDTVDVVIVGDSLSYSDLVPIKMYSDYGISSYVAGTAAQKLPETIKVLKEAFKNQSPKYVLLETNCIFRNLPIREAIKNVIGNMFPVFNYHNRWKELTVNDLKMKFNYTYFKNSKGYRFSSTYNAAVLDDYMAPTTEKEKIPEVNKEYLEQIKEICDKNGAELIFVSVPSVKCYNMKKYNSLCDLTNELGVRYFDMNLIHEEVGIDWNVDSRDKGDHLNYNGAIKASDYLAKYLVGFGNLTDHRGEEAYSKWDEETEDFYSIINSKLGQ